MVKEAMGREKIEVFSPPFKGHANILEEFAQKYGKQYEIGLNITGWNNIQFRPENPQSVVTTFAKTELKSTDPALWTFDRANALLPDCLKILQEKKPNLIIYDFFSLEGKLAADLLGIPSWCSIPALIGPYDNQEYIKGKLAAKANVKAIAELRKNFGIEINQSKIEGLSDGFLFPGQHNLVWSYIPIARPDFMTNRQPLPYSLVGNLRAERPTEIRRTNTTPVVYFSFGTVVMDNLWNHQPETRAQMQEFVGALAKLWERENLKVIFTTQGKEVLSRYPDNWEVHDYVDQVRVLSQADVFITHGGNNSFHEALKQNIPMVVVPFFGDQPAVAQRAADLGVGIDLSRVDSIDTNKSYAFLNREFADEVNWAVHTVLTEPQYRDSYKDLKFMAVSLHALLKSSIYLKSPQQIKYEELPEPVNPLPLKRGQPVYGVQAARVLFEERGRAEDKLHFWKLNAPFSAYATSTSDLPAIVDTYHDSLRNEDFLEQDLSSDMTQYKKLLQAYHTFLNGEKDICQMCIKGLDFFSELFGVRFLVDRYDPQVNYITTREIAYVLKNKQRFAGRTTFYSETADGWHEVEYEQVESLIHSAVTEITLGVDDSGRSRDLWERGVYVASGSPIKIAASQGAISENAPDLPNLTVKGIMPAIKMNEQLVGIEETIFEATHRLLSLRKMLEETGQEYGLIISTCNGILEEDGKWQDAGVVIMIDSEGRTAISRSEGVVFPDEYVRIAKERGFETTTVGSVIAEQAYKSGATQEDIGIDPHTYLTGGRLTRTGLLLQAISRALAQLDNEA